MMHNIDSNVHVCAPSWAPLTFPMLNVLLTSICATCFGAYVLTVEKVEFEKKLKRTNVDSPVSHHICVMSVWWFPLVPKCTKHIFL